MEVVLTDTEISSIVSEVLKDRLPEAGFHRAEVSTGTDFDGESIIRVTAYYDRRPLTRPDALMSAVHDIRSALLSRGEERFVFLTNDVVSEHELDEGVE